MEFVVWFNSDLWNLLFDFIQIYGICCLISFRFMLFDFIQIYVVWLNSDVWNLLFDFIQIYVVWFHSDLCCLIEFRCMEFVVWFNLDLWNLLFDLIQMYGICCLIWNWTSLGVMFWMGEFIQCPFVCFLCVIFSKYICFIVWFDLKRACWQITVCCPKLNVTGVLSAFLIPYST